MALDSSLSAIEMTALSNSLITTTGLVLFQSPFVCTASPTPPSQRRELGRARLHSASLVVVSIRFRNIADDEEPGYAGCGRLAALPLLPKPVQNIIER